MNNTNITNYNSIPDNYNSYIVVGCIIIIITFIGYFIKIYFFEDNNENI